MGDGVEHFKHCKIFPLIIVYNCLIFFLEIAVQSKTLLLEPRINKKKFSYKVYVERNVL